MTVFSWNIAEVGYFVCFFFPEVGIKCQSVFIPESRQYLEVEVGYCEPLVSSIYWEIFVSCSLQPDITSKRLFPVWHGHKILPYTSSNLI